MAVFYPNKFFNPSIKFLDWHPGEVFVHRSDTEQVERKYVFRRRLRVELKGKKEFSVKDYGSIEKDYKEFKKNYLLEGKGEVLGSRG